MMKIRFLTARWANLILAQYRLPEQLLQMRLPPGIELDLFDGSAWGSLVGFQFLDTKVLGIPWPGYVNFPEINLRFYVKHGDRRGVCFVREIVPQRMTALVARTIYNEPYVAAPMTMDVREESDRISVRYSARLGGREHSMRVLASSELQKTSLSSPEHHFKEHSWGFGTTRSGKCLVYEVRHPEWLVRPVVESSIDVDWRVLYGPEWECLNAAVPESVFLAHGSAVDVFPHGVL